MLYNCIQTADNMQLKAIYGEKNTYEFPRIL